MRPRQQVFKFAGCGRDEREAMYCGYDAADRLTAETWTASDESTLHAFEWAYDDVGNRRASLLTTSRWSTCT